MTGKKQKENKEQEIVIDAENALLGRLASFSAKQVLKGKKVIIVNSEKAVISGNKQSIIKSYREKKARGGSSQKGPFFPKLPERILKRTIRGMLPKGRGRGRNAIKLVRCYKDLPVEYKDTKKITAGKKKDKVISLGMVSNRI